MRNKHIRNIQFSLKCLINHITLQYIHKKKTWDQLFYTKWYQQTVYPTNIKTTKKNNIFF